MSQPLPSTTALQAFATAARTLSFKEAARELHVSPSALSRQVQGLEEHLGTPLFVRLNPGIELTEAGQLYFERVERLLGELRAAELELTTEAAPLRVSALESFSARWLVPHLPEFRAAHPHVDVEIEATLRYADLRRDPIDVALRFGEGPWEGLHSEPLLDLNFFPVCSPSLIQGDPPLRSPADLANHPWIHVTQVPDAWDAWRRHVGLPELEGTRDVSFDHVGIALSAAESGQGVALSATPLCAAEVAAGRLRIPFDLPVASSSTYHLVCLPERIGDPRITAFRDWLVASLS